MSGRPLPVFSHPQYGYARSSTVQERVAADDRTMAQIIRHVLRHYLQQASVGPPLTASTRACRLLAPWLAGDRRRREVSARRAAMSMTDHFHNPHLRAPLYAEHVGLRRRSPRPAHWLRPLVSSDPVPRRHDLAIRYERRVHAVNWTRRCQAAPRDKKRVAVADRSIFEPN